MDATEFLLAKMQGRNPEKESQDKAVNRLLSMGNPEYREPEHRDDAGVMQLVKLTNRELLRQNGRR